MDSGRVGGMKRANKDRINEVVTGYMKKRNFAASGEVGSR